jgi:hypothetical protein
MRVVPLIAAALLIAAAQSARADGTTKTIWEGTIHLGDSPSAYPKVTSAGMTFQVPFRMGAGKATKLTVRAADIETQAGNGHYVEVLAHFEKQPSKAPAKGIVVATFRIKDKSADEKSYVFEFDSSKNLGDLKPDYYSVRIKVDTHVSFTFWDDVLIKRIVIEQE